MEREIALALEVLRNLFPRRAGGNSLAGLSNFGVVFISTGANVPFYIGNLFFLSLKRIACSKSAIKLNVNSIEQG